MAARPRRPDPAALDTGNVMYARTVRTPEYRVLSRVQDSATPSSKGHGESEGGIGGQAMNRSLIISLRYGVI